VLLAAADDWGWTTARGERITDELAPDPLLVGHLASASTTGAVFVDDLTRVPDDLRELLAKLFAEQRASAIVPVASRDELLALLVVPATAKRLRGRELEFVESAAERLGEAVVHVRMAARAAERAEVAREVELAAAVQQQLLPSTGPRAFGDVTVVGSWHPATRCAGDFWACYELADGRTLIAIGDVTGHGVASATVTAAAAAACDVVARRDREALVLDDLVAALDAAVRRVGGGQLAMTCCATILDPVARELRFVSCGHTTPYLCRPSAEGLELVALVARGNPLGTDQTTTAKVQQRALQAGDLVIWYTDGVIDAQDAAGQAFGNGRLQRLLRRVDRARATPVRVHDLVDAALATHRGSRARLDDETIVVAQWQPARSGPP
jgi:serine phosphatase RsbU (regulator of sigma subunit)